MLPLHHIDILLLMKKITLSLLFAVITASFAYSQTLKIILQGGNGAYYNDSTIIVSGSSADNLIPSPTFDVVNTGADTVTIQAKRTIISQLAGASSAICFAGTCAPESDNTNPYSVYLGPGDTAQLGNAFTGDYYPNGANGLTSIRYTFFNYNHTDTAWFIVNYETSPTGVASVSGHQINFSAPYPNPANSFVNFSYSLTNGTQAATMKIFNIVGECVQTLPLSAAQNKSTINVQNIPAGIYVCEIVANGCQPVYQKMVVTH